MDIKKLAPWNWFKDEEKHYGHPLPIEQGHTLHSSTGNRPLSDLHRGIDRYFEQMFDQVLSPFSGASDALIGSPLLGGSEMRPSIDVVAAEKEYLISVEVPGVDEKDVKLELNDETLTIRGEKHAEFEDNSNGYYRMERTYGTFQRVLNLPSDSDLENIQAKFKNGVLAVSVARKAVESKQAKEIPVSRAA